MNRLFLFALGFLLLATARPVSAQNAPQDTIWRRPVFTPFTQRPELIDPREARRIVQNHYPAELRETGIGGSVMTWVFVDVDGRVKNTVIHESSGHEALDRAAMAAIRQFRFVPARLHKKVVPVWIAVPITFAAVELTARTQNAPKGWAVETLIGQP